MAVFPLNAINAQALQFVLNVENVLNDHAAQLLKQPTACLFTRLAFNLCPVYKAEPLARANLRPLLEGSARTIIETAWQTALKEKTGTFLIIAGGGPGAGKLSTCLNPPISLSKEVSVIYDASEHSIHLLRERIEQAHSRNIHTIVCFIERPLDYAAASVIVDAVNHGHIPDPKEFAYQHVQTKENFLALVAHYKKKKELFSPIVLFNHKTREAYTTSHKDLKHAHTSFSDITNLFEITWSQLHAGPLPIQRPLQPLNKSRKSKNSTTARALMVAHLLGQTLRRNVSKPVAPEITNNNHGGTKTSSPNHDHYHGPTRTFIESTDQWRSQTLEGRRRSLDNNRPARIVMKEKTTHPHDMEVTLER